MEQRDADLQPRNVRGAGQRRPQVLRIAGTGA
jgi:hypothetical protein